MVNSPKYNYVCTLYIIFFNFFIIIGKRAFIAGVADDNGYGWAIAKALAAAGAEILVGTWVPVSPLLIPSSFFNNQFDYLFFFLSEVVMI